MSVVSFFPTLRARLSSSVRFTPMARWLEYSGMTAPATYIAIARGQIRAKKLGRTLLIDVASGDEHLDSLPDAKLTRTVSAHAPRSSSRSRASSAPELSSEPAADRRFEFPPAVP